ncbi:MAG: methyltransferase domain-containing protein [Candidatus Eisenbacteria bacterium]
MTASDHGYIHGTHPEEQRRLSALNDIINARCLEALALRGGERVLDVGSGLGQFTRLMATAAGTRVVGVEASAEQLAEARRQAVAAGDETRVDFRQGDALTLALPETEWGRYDVVHTRFVLEHVADPLAVVRAMTRAVAPGGRIVLADDDHDVLRLWPEPPGLETLWRAYIATYERAGRDPYVGRKLVELLHAAGLSPARNTWIWFGGCSGDPLFPALVRNLLDILAGAREAILATGRVDAKAFDDAVAATHAWATRPDAALWFAIAWAEGIKDRPVAR